MAGRTAISSGALTRTYSYDAAGHTASYSTVTIGYNHRGRARAVSKGAVTETLVYNALGQLVKTSGGPLGTELFVYDEAGHLLGEYSSTGALVQETVWLGDIPVATVRPGTPAQVFYLHTDHLNTPRVVTRPSDNKKRWTWLSDPFGTELPNNNPESLGAFTLNLRFPGQVFDGQAGLQQNWFRDYDPAIGRYVQSDPIGLSGGVNTYSYARANPVMFIDPRGLQTPALCLNPANVEACAAAGEISEATAAAVRAAVKRSAARAAAILLGYTAGREICKDKDEDCTKEIEECSEMCTEAQSNPDRRRVYGGSMTQCMKSCLPERCGGEPKWKGYK